MMPATPITATIQDQVRAAFAADPKRTLVLAGLSLILVVLCLRAALRSGPATATASMPQLLVPLDPQSPLALTSNRIGSSNALVDWLSQPKRGPKRNLFAMPLASYTRDSRGPSGPSDSDSSDESAKSVSSHADQNGDQDNLRKQAMKLKLQSTFLGPSPMALVNGQLVREGDIIEQFKVVRIEPRQIVVEQNGVTLRISMD